ncbi:hypothetical protein [Caulobacter segnis]
MLGAMHDRPFDAFRAWWIYRKDVAGLAIAALAFVILAMLVAPFAAGTLVEGRVVEFQKLGLKGVELYAVVDLSGQKVSVRLSVMSDCHVGSTITLQKRPSLTGMRYSAPGGCR